MPVSKSLSPAAQHGFNTPYSITAANELNQVLSGKNLSCFVLWPSRTRTVESWPDNNAILLHLTAA